MKKVLTVLAIAAFAVSFTACKKDYTCTCTHDLLGTATPTKYEYTKVKKDDAETACTDTEAVHKLAELTATCSL